jgi:hypothetical protein
MFKPLTTLQEKNLLPIAQSKNLSVLTYAFRLRNQQRNMPKHHIVIRQNSIGVITLPL